MQTKVLDSAVVLHEILDGTSGGFEDITRARFIALLANTMPIRSMAAASGQPSNGVILTFDDGHLSDLDVALPLLQSAGASATFFIVPDFVGKDGFMCWDGIRTLHASGMEIGSHSMTHPDFRTLDSQSAKDEFIRSKDAIEAEIGAEIRSFAFPFGFAPRWCFALARAAGYKHIMGSQHGCISTHYDHILPRNSIHGRMNDSQIMRVMQPDFATRGLWWCEDRVKVGLKALLPRPTYHWIRGVIAGTGRKE